MIRHPADLPRAFASHRQGPRADRPTTLAPAAPVLPPSRMSTHSLWRTGSPHLSPRWSAAFLRSAASRLAIGMENCSGWRSRHAREGSVMRERSSTETGQAKKTGPRAAAFLIGEIHGSGFSGPCLPLQRVEGVCATGELDRGWVGVIADATGIEAHHGALASLTTLLGKTTILGVA